MFMLEIPPRQSYKISHGRRFVEYVFEVELSVPVFHFVKLF